jgi:PAS domain S-box-containing protein
LPGSNTAVRTQGAWPLGRPAAQTVVKAAAAGLIVFALAWASISVTIPAGRVAVFWPANALVVAALVNRRAVAWPAFLLAGFLGNLAADLVGGDPIVTAASLSAVNVLEVVLCAAGLRRLIGVGVNLSKRRHLAAFAAAAAAAAATAALSAATWMRFMNREGFGQTFLMWTMADVLGLLIVTPPLLMLNGPALRRFTAPGRLGANLGMLGALAAATLAVFVQRQVPASFVLGPLLVLVAFYAETAGAALGVLIVSVIAATASSLGLGPSPIHPGGSETTALLLQLFLLVNAATAFLVGAAIRRRRELEEGEAARADEFQLLADHSTDVIVRLDASDRILYVSPSCSLFGYQQADLIGTIGFDLIHPDDAAKVRAMVADVFSPTGPTPNLDREQRIRTARGEWVWVEGNPQVICDAAGRPIEFVTQLRNINARKALEAELERKRAEAEAAAVAKSEFLANMSHEIRTPLTGVIGFSGMLQRVEGLSDDGRRCVEQIVASGQALLSVVNDILDFSKIEAGQLELDPHPFAPAAFVSETVALVQAQADAKGLALAVNAAADLPAAVEADAARLRQVLLNLLANAIKFTDAGGVTVEVGYDRAQRSLRIAVADTGVGIPADRLDRLFQRFSQADGSITRQFGGTGLGLAIAKSLSELMGGTVGVASTPGQGSTFWFTVAAPPAASVAPMRLHEDRPAYAGPTARVLVVDDNAVNREVVKALLEGLGLTLLEAASGVEAVERATANPFDLILMDLQMPGMDGLAATRAIRDGAGPNRGTPIVALSANVLSQHLDACREAGMNDHIGKPINAAELLTKVAHWTSQAEAKAIAAQA